MLRATGKGELQTEIALLTLPEVLPPWEQVDYDVREEYFHAGGNHLGYCVRHLENLCGNLGLRVRRTAPAGLKDLGDMILLVPDASRMTAATRAALDQWVSQAKPVIVFGEVPLRWALQYGIQVVDPKKTAGNPRKYNSIYFPSENLTIPGKPLNYASYIAGNPVAMLTSSENPKDRSTFVCRHGSLLLCGWIPRLHAWDVIGEQDEHRFFARLLKEFRVEISVPEFSSERIRNLKSFGGGEWGLWSRGALSPSNSVVAGSGFDYVYEYGSYFSDIIDRKFEEKLLGVPLSSQMKSVPAHKQLGYLQEMIERAHESSLKLFVVITPFPVSSPYLYQELLRRDGLQYRYTNGVLHPTSLWSPANSGMVRLAIEALREFLAHTKVDGVFIDFARYLDDNFDYGPEMRRIFEEQTGGRIENWPATVVDDPDLARRYAALKRKVMTDFLGEFGLAAKQMQKDIVTEALFYWGYWPGKGGAYELIGQDPKTLIKMGALDRACGMFYTSDNRQLETLVDEAVADVGLEAFSCILSPISYFNEYNTTYQFIDQIKILKNKGVRHASVYSHIPRHLIYNRLGNKE